MSHATPVRVLLERPLTRETIAGLRLRALRRRVWYGALDRIERGLVDLTIRWVDKVRSGRMARVLLRILEKLARAMEQRIVRVLTMGRDLALRASMLAVEWGDSQAYSWRFDEGFWRGLGSGVL
jgi:hypothetical protein